MLDPGVQPLISTSTGFFFPIVEHVFDAIAVLPTTFNALCLCWSSQVCCWPSPQLLGSRNINKNGEFMGITLLLLEEKVPSSSL